MNDLLQFQRNIKLHCQNHQYSSGKYHYLIIVSILTGEATYKFDVQKTKTQILKLHETLNKCIFQLQEPFQKKFINQQQPQQTIHLINVYLNHLKSRLDCLTSRHFIEFFDIEKRFPDAQILQKSHLHQLSQVKINPDQKQQIVDLAWQAQSKIFFIISQCKKQKKITNFLKSLISNQTRINGTLQIIKFQEKQNKWKKVKSQLIQAQPLKLVWNKKYSTLIVSTLIGIYVYMVGLQNQITSLNLIDFVQLPGIQSICCDSQTAEIYILSNGINNQGKSKLFSYSIKKQLNIQIPVKLNKAKSMIFQKYHRRLYVSEQEGIKIFHIQNDPSRLILQNISKVHTVKCDSIYDELTLSTEQKSQFLFGYNKKGFITVFETKPTQKQHLMNILTNIQIPANYSSISCLWSKKIFCTNYKGNLSFISMKNQPLWVKEDQIGIQKVNKIIYDEQNERLIYSNNQVISICQVSF